MVPLFGRIAWGVTLLATAMGFSLLRPTENLNVKSDSSSSIVVAPTKGVFMVGEKIPFTLDMTSRNAVNTVEGTLLVRGTEVQFTQVLSDKSFLTIWVNEPAVNTAGNEIHFAGGIPNPGFTGQGTLLRGSITVKKPGKIFVTVGDPQAFLNDGKGTGITPSAGVAEYAIFPQGTLSPDINGDSIVDANDIAMIFKTWDRRGSSRYDLNGDGRVGVGDLSIILSLMRTPEIKSAPSPSGLRYIVRSLASFLGAWF